MVRTAPDSRLLALIMRTVSPKKTHQEETFFTITNIGGKDITIILLKIFIHFSIETLTLSFCEIDQHKNYFRGKNIDPEEYHPVTNPRYNKII